jgi:hypothetical protein
MANLRDDGRHFDGNGVRWLCEPIKEDAMTKHLADHRSAPENGRMMHFLSIERTQQSDAPHPRLRGLTERPKDRDDSLRLKRFIGIERSATD